MAFKQHFYGSALRIAVLHEQQAARFEGHESLLSHGYQVFQPFRLIRGSGRGMAVAAAVVMMVVLMFLMRMVMSAAAAIAVIMVVFMLVLMVLMFVFM